MLLRDENFSFKDILFINGGYEIKKISWKSKEFVTLLASRPKLCQGMNYLSFNGAKLNAEWKALAIDCTKQTAVLQVLSLSYAKLTPHETCEILRALINSKSIEIML